MAYDLSDHSVEMQEELARQFPEYFPISPPSPEKPCAPHGFRSPCDDEACRVCFAHFRPANDLQGITCWGYSEALSNEEAMDISTRFNNSMEEDLEYIRGQIKLNGNTILKRWKKKSPAERKTFLLSMDPSMYENQWCDVQLMSDYQSRGAKAEPIEEGLSLRPYKNALLLPYVNLTSLSKDPMNLLGLLYYRSEYSPQQWSTYDNSQLDKQWEIGSFATNFNSGSISLGIGGLKYGEWLHWTPEHVHNHMALGFPRGILLLEAQSSLLHFLRGSVERLLEGLARQDAAPKSERFMSLFGERSVSSAGNGSKGSRLSSAFINQPFSAPPLFDLAALNSICTLQKDLVGDHLAFLQTDASYMRNHIGQLQLMGGADDKVWQKSQIGVIGQYILKDAGRYLSWERICEEVCRLQETYATLQEDNSPGKPLSTTYKTALTCLNAHLLEEARERCTFIERALPTRPGFIKNYQFQWVRPHGKTAVLYRRADTTETCATTFITDRLEFCLRILVQDPWNNPMFFGQSVDTSERVVKRFEPSTIFAMLDQHLAESDKDEISRLDQVLLELYTDLSAIFQMLSMLRLHQPTFEQKIIGKILAAQSQLTGKAWRYAQRGLYSHTKIVSAEYTSKFEFVQTNANHAPVPKAAALKCNPGAPIKLIKTFLSTPRPTAARITDVWVEQDKIEQGNLNNIWGEMGVQHSRTLENIGIEHEDIEEDMKAFCFAITPEHLTEVRIEREGIRAKTAARAAEQAAKNNRKAGKVALQTQWGEDKQEQQSLPVLESKTKPKTRGLPEDFVPEIDPPPERETSEPTITVAVNKRALSVFKAMFPRRNSEERSRAVEWDAFVTAIAEEGVGFIARHSAGGSAYTFELNQRSLWSGKGAISFHKPHSEHTIDAITVMAHGKRMSKWFGWSEETFVLKK